MSEPAWVPEAQRLRDEGLNNVAIARALGLPASARSSVWYWLLLPEQRDEYNRVGNMRRRSRSTFVDPEPFRAWVRCKLPLYDDSLHNLAVACHVDESWLQKLVTGCYARVRVDVVDRALTREGSTHLREVYPGWYAQEEVAA